MPTAPDTTLPGLIHAFLDAQQRVQITTWRLVDLAAAVRAPAGSRGLHALASASGLTVNYVRTYARLARLFPPETRVSSLTFHHHVQASSAGRKFPVGTPEHDPSFWLTYARERGQGVAALHDAMRHHTVAGATLATREAFARTRVRDAARARHTLIPLTDAFNREYAPFWGSRLVITESPLLMAPPAFRFATPVTVPVPHV